jgi:ATP-dependent DNA ligase
MANRAGAPCFDNGLAVFERIRYRRHDGKVSSLLRGSLSGLHLNEHLAHPGDVVFRHACKMGPEGIVSKRLGSRYRSGRSSDWAENRTRQP